MLHGIIGISIKQAQPLNLQHGLKLFVSLKLFLI